MVEIELRVELFRQSASTVASPSTVLNACNNLLPHVEQVSPSHSGLRIATVTASLAETRPLTSAR